MTHIYRTWIEISKSTIRKNYQTFRRIIGKKPKLLAVVKSNAYGHELMGFAKTMAALGADFIGVDSITEARTLREEGINTPLLVQGYTLPALFKLAAHKNITLTISTLESLKQLFKLNQHLEIHLKIETGMNRQGLMPDDLTSALTLLQANNKIKLTGVYTHLASAKKPDTSHDTEKQLAKFKEAVELVKSFGFKPIVHACATAGTLNYPEAHFDMVRIGIGLYGLWPSKETQNAHQKKISLYPALTWKALVSEIKWVEKGGKVGYDYTEMLTRRTRLAVIPLGYWHGYWRAFSGKAHVLIRGKRCKVMGRVSMDMIVVDVTDVKGVKVGDTAVLLGRQGKENITAEELAGLANTTNYEIVTRLNPLIKKIYIP